MNRYIRLFRFLRSSQVPGSFRRFLRWQIASRISRSPTTFRWVDDTQLTAERGSHAITGNLYQGLMEPFAMAFTLHLLRDTDLFVDVGANLGTFTVLASGAVGAHSIAIEPVPSTFRGLMDHLNMNQLNDLVEAHQAGASSSAGYLRFTTEQGTTNRVTLNGYDSNTLVSKVDTLDNIIGDREPLLIKIDVEGHDLEVLAGASNVLSRPSLKALIVEVAEQPEITPLLSQAGFERYQYSLKDRALVPIQFNPHNNTLFLRDLDFIQDRVASSRRFTVFGKEF